MIALFSLGIVSSLAQLWHIGAKAVRRLKGRDV